MGIYAWICWWIHGDQESWPINDDPLWYPGCVHDDVICRTHIVIAARRV